MRLSELSIRTALASVVCIAITPALGIIIWSGLEQNKLMEIQTKQEVMNKTEAFAEIQVRITDSTYQLLALLAALPEFQNQQWEAMEKTLKAIHSRNDDYLNITVTDEAGIVTVSSLLPAGTDLHTRPHVAQALKTRSFSPGEYIVSLVESTPSFPYSFPIINEAGMLRGTINGIYKLSSYQYIFDQLMVPVNSILGFVDRHGQRLLYYPENMVTNPIGVRIKQDVWEKMREGPDQEVFIALGSDGIKRYYAYKKIRLAIDQDPYIHVVYATPTAAASTTSRNLIIRNILLILATTLLALILANLLYLLGFGRRLLDIVRTADAIGAGSLNARTNTTDNSPDLGRIGRAINQMAQTIEQRHMELEEYGERLVQTLEEKNMLLKEVHHRVKNNLQLILSMFHLQNDSQKDPAEFREGMENRIASMALVHEMLYETENKGLVELSSYAQRILELINGYGGINSQIRMELRTEPVSVRLDKAVPFGILVNELVTNCIKHSFDTGMEGKLILILEPFSKDKFRLEVADTGQGLPDNFQLKDSKGLGLHLATALALQLGGELTWWNAAGAHFSVVFSLNSKDKP